MIVCSHEMKNCQIIIQKFGNDTIRYRFFAIDPTAGYLFLTKHDEKFRNGAAIMRYTMDGVMDKSLITDKLFYPNDVTLDVAVKKVYFLDHYFEFIQQCDYDGSNRRFLQKLPLLKFHRITFFEHFFYGAVNRNSSVIQINKSSSTFKKVLAENLKASTKMLKVFHQQVQPTEKSKTCANSKCQHLCVPYLEGNGPNSRVVEKCLCKEGFNNENGNCIMKASKRFLMFLQEHPRILKAVDIGNSSNQVFTPIGGLKSNIAFDVDLSNNLIYFTSYSDPNR